MFTLLLQTFRHIFRTRLVFLLVGLSFLVHWFGLHILTNLKVQLPGQMSLGPLLKEPDYLFMSLFLQLFTGTFLAAVFGIWTVPYLHQGQRAQLTFTLPIAKWKFPLGYALTMLALLFILHAVMLGTFAWTFGMKGLTESRVPWSSVGLCLLVQTIAFEVIMFAFALGSLIFGQVTTFFIGVASILWLQISGIIFRVSFLPWQHIANPDAPQSPSLYYLIYSRLPPVGELAFDLWKQFKKPSWEEPHLGLWIAWLVILGGLFYFRMTRPPRSRVAEG